MVGTTRQGIPSWISAAASRGVELDANLTTSVSDNMARSPDEEIEEQSSLQSQSQSHHHSKTLSDFNLGFAERAFSAAGAAVLSAVLVNPLDVAKAFKEAQGGVKPSGLFKTLSAIVSPVGSGNSLQNLQSYRLLWTGLGAQLARDVPFSAICWSTLEPIRRRIFGLMGDEISAANVLGANFCAGFFSGSLAAAATCPLDVAKTRRQIEKDPTRALKMTTKQTLLEIWRDGGMKGLFTGVGPRVARAGPSVGIVVTFYEVVKYALHQRHFNQ